jgi:hypothetical protein
LDYTIAFRQSTAAIDSTICEGGQVALGDTVYRTSGTFVRNISKSSVCDSTVTLTLKVNPVSSFTQNIKICEGETLAVGDSSYKVSGTYINHIPKITGCDSIVITNLEVIQMDVSVTADRVHYAG